MHLIFLLWSVNFVFTTFFLNAMDWVSYQLPFAWLQIIAGHLTSWGVGTPRLSGCLLQPTVRQKVVNTVLGLLDYWNAGGTPSSKILRTSAMDGQLEGPCEVQINPYLITGSEVIILGTFVQLWFNQWQEMVFAQQCLDMMIRQYIIVFNVLHLPGSCTKAPRAKHQRYHTSQCDSEQTNSGAMYPSALSEICCSICSHQALEELGKNIIWYASLIVLST
jgi:hypothetical protein